MGAGWTYYDVFYWKSDPTLVVSREVTPVCAEIIVEVKGEAKEKHPELDGHYLPLKGKMNRGRWVLQHSDVSEKYLSVHTNSGKWVISDNIEGWLGESWIRSASAGNSCPAHASNAVNN